MISTVVKRAWLVGLLGVAAAVILVASSGSGPESATAATPGATVAPLLSCPNVDGSIDNKVLISDIVAVVQAYFKDYPSTSYAYLYDLDTPYNPQTGAGGLQRIGDILAVITKYFTVCPLVDTQVAQATRWAIDMDGNPGNGAQAVPQIESEAALEAIGYYRTTTDVPGQGVHYVNNQNWDGIFDPKAPEGIVYNNGRLAAQLYVSDAAVVGLGTHAPNACYTPPTPSGCPGAEYGIELEAAGDGPQCSPACSWSGAEYHHLHHYLCSVNIGMPSAVSIPGSLVPGVGNSDAACKSYSGSNPGGLPDDPLCTVPITAQPCYTWSQNSGWMGHLYNWYPNANRIADVNATTNGRFADCFPDTEGWKASNCPG